MRTIAKALGLAAMATSFIALAHGAGAAMLGDGVTAVGDSPREARILFDRTKEVFDREARKASEDRELPPVE